MCDFTFFFVFDGEQASSARASQRVTMSKGEKKNLVFGVIMFFYYLVSLVFGTFFFFFFSE